MRGSWVFGGAVGALLLSLAFAGPASASTCADYDNQADAQRAADTRDADGDGIYCESLPCPCLKPGQSDKPSQPKSPGKVKKPAKPKPKPLTGRARIVGVPAPGIVDVRISKAGRSPGLKSRERVRLIGITAPASGRCGYKESLADLLEIAFGDAAHDRDADGLVDSAPSTAGALVDVRTDLKVKPTRDGRGRLRAYLDAGHTGTDIGRRLVADGWAAADYGTATRSQRLLDAQDAAAGAGRGAWVLCHADFDRPAAERFDGFVPCEESFNPDGSPYDDVGSGFIRNVMVSGGECAAAAPVIKAWSAVSSADPTEDTDGDGNLEASASLPDGTTCRWEWFQDGENPAVEGRCTTPAALTVVWWAAP